MKKRKSIILMAACVLALCLTIQVNTNLKAATDDHIADGIYIGDIYVGGMTEEEANAAVDAYVESVNTAEFVFYADDRSIELTAEDIGLYTDKGTTVKQAMDICRSGNLIKKYKDMMDLKQGDKIIELPLNLDTKAVTAVLEENLEELNLEAVDNTLVRENGEFKYVAGTTGVEINVASSVALIEEFIQNEWDGASTSIELVAQIQQPRGSEEELAKVKDVLGSFTTYYSTATPGRCTNIRVATEKINGTLLYPGDELSVNALIRPIDKAHGYELGGAYENGQVIESYGGGVCQVSTTLYNAAIFAEMDITQRAPHSMTVSYVQPSMDAAIAGDYKDLKFVNNMDTPVYVEGHTTGKSVQFNIYGVETRPSNRKISFVSEVISQTDPGVQFVATAHPVGYVAQDQPKHIGYVSRLWKVVTVDGVEQSREKFNNSTYRAAPKVVHVGTASPDPNVTAAINAAIATGDEATVYATVGMYAQPAPPAQ